MHGDDRAVERSIRDIAASIDTIRLAISIFPGNPPRGLVSLLRDEEARLASLERFREGDRPKALTILSSSLSSLPTKPLTPSSKEPKTPTTYPALNARSNSATTRSTSSNAGTSPKNISPRMAS